MNVLKASKNKSQEDWKGLWVKAENYFLIYLTMGDIWVRFRLLLLSYYIFTNISACSLSGCTFQNNR